MASSRHYSNGADWTDVAAHLIAFRAINTMEVEIRMAAVDSGGLADLQITLVATEPKIEGQEVKSLGSVNVRCSATNRRTIEDALIQALYMLDGQCARGEMAGTLSA